MTNTFALRLAAMVPAIVATASTVFAQGATIRIEPRPFYGATITLEEGVRVFRPLPPERYVIINPGNRTPLNLSLSEQHVYEQSSSNNYHYDATRPSPYAGRAIGGYGLPFYGPGKPDRPKKKHVPGF